jgi:hypothetical protein
VLESTLVQQQRGGIPAGRYQARLLGAAAKDVGDVSTVAGETRELRY